MGARMALAVAGAALLGALAGCGQWPQKPRSQLVGCSLPAPTAPAPAGAALVTQAYGTQATPIPLQAVLHTHEWLAQNIATQGLFTGRTEGGTVQVTARLVNCTDAPLVVRARTSFLARSGAPAEPQSAWQNVALPARATALYTERSISAEGVESYFIELAPSP